jgi:hypothetical protein
MRATLALTLGLCIATAFIAFASAADAAPDDRVCRKIGRAHV